MVRFVSGTSRWPYYYVPLVCVLIFLGGVAVWRLNQTKQNKTNRVLVGHTGPYTKRILQGCHLLWSRGTWRGVTETGAGSKPRQRKWSPSTDFVVGLVTLHGLRQRVLPVTPRRLHPRSRARPSPRSPLILRPAACAAPDSSPTARALSWPSCTGVSMRVARLRSALCTRCWSRLPPRRPLILSPLACTAPGSSPTALFTILGLLSNLGLSVFPDRSLVSSDVISDRDSTPRPPRT